MLDVEGLVEKGLVCVVERLGAVDPLALWWLLRLLVATDLQERRDDRYALLLATVVW